MDWRITARRTKASKKTQEFLEKELHHLERFHDRITSCHVVLDQEHSDRIVEITMSLQGSTVNARAKAESYGKAAVEAVDRIERQLKRYKERLKAHKGLREKEEAV